MIKRLQKFYKVLLMIRMFEPALLAYKDDIPLVWPEHHVFLIGTSNYFESIQNMYTEILSDLEINKAKRYLRSEDFKGYVVGKYFLRKTLSKLLNQSPESIEFNTAANKKPCVRGVEFNLSRSADMVAVALSTMPIGIDTEFIQEGFSYDMMLDDCFSKAEQSMIKNESHPLSTFYTLWTRKEALLKASGKGLNSDYSLNQIEVIQSDPLLHHGHSYLLTSSLLFDQYILSVAKNSSLEKIHYWYI